MPRENKKRGRRAEEKKRKLEETEGEEFDAAKRQRVSDPDFAEQEGFVALDAQEDAYKASGEGNGYEQRPELPFFGMLDEEEQEYFKRADEMLEMNNFADPTERSLFLANVYREAEGKELKIANSQSCSRLMERLIQLSSPSQLKTLFQTFSGNFMHLIQHRFASHCCEKLFIRAAPFVTKELLAPPSVGAEEMANGDVYVSMENLFLYTIGELEGNIGFLMTDRFASHALRVLLLVFAGEPLVEAKSLLQSKKKEHVSVHGESQLGEEQQVKRAVPDSFTEALQTLMSSSVAGLDTTSLRALATHQVGNPTLQLLIKLELNHFGKQKAKEETSILRTLLPDDPITPESDSATFINGIIYDPIGSHLVEAIVENAPGKMFKSLYKGLLKDRMASLARNEIAGYVVCKVLERLSKDDLYAAHEQILPTIPALVERSRFGVIKTLMQRCQVREIDTRSLASQLAEAYKTADGGFDIRALLHVSEIELPAPVNGDSNGIDGEVQAPRQAAQDPSRNTGARLQGSLLAQEMIDVPGALSSLVFDSLVTLSPESLLAMSRDPIISRTLQAAMSSPNATVISRRKLIQLFYGNIGEMALEKSASRVVDAIWDGTHGLAFIRERIAEELAEDEPALRDSPCGRAVWKNWKMDLYKRKRGEWIKQSKIKASNDGFQSFSEVDKNKSVRSARKQTRNGEHTPETAQRQNGAEEQQKPKKTALQLARERHVAKKAKEASGGGFNKAATGANASAIS
ncbi:hypothetical protein AAFC00_006659 [Neodothiora populina]|uniref:Nucleolar protein 9 n=1 Tax=Neodothiora populina TaxID=2781224 RepID=A0ABR3PB09_9PEZI